MKFKRFLSFALSFALLFCVCSCTKSDGEEKKQVAVIVKSLDSDFWNNAKSGVECAATEYNMTVTFEGPENEDDYEAQNEMISNAIERGVDAIVLSAIDYSKSSELIDYAARKGIKIIAIDSSVNSQMISLFIGTDNLEAGKALGQAAISGFSEDEKIYIGVVNYNKSTDNGQLREEGFREYVSAFPNVEISSVVNVKSTVESATEGAIKMLWEHPEINVIVGLNEIMTLGIGNAVKQFSLSEKVRTVGFDTNIISISMIETGEMDALIVQNPFAMGYLSIKSASELISGELKTPTSNIYTNVTTVTKENLFDEDIQKILFRFE